MAKSYPFKVKTKIKPQPSLFTTILAFVKAARLPALILVFPPLWFGYSFASFSTNPAPEQIPLSMTMGWTTLFLVFLGYTNDLGDFDADSLNTSPTSFSGGSRVLQNGTLSFSTLSIASVLVWIAWGGVTWLFHIPPVFFGGLTTCLLLYSLPPFRLSYKGFGEILQGIGIGIFLPLLGYYSFSGTYSLYPCVGPFIYAFGSNIVTALPDRKADKLAGKNTLVVRLGLSTARTMATVIFCIAPIVQFIMIPGTIIPCFLSILLTIGAHFMNFNYLKSRNVLREYCYSLALAQLCSLVGGAVLMTQQPYQPKSIYG